MKKITWFLTMLLALAFVGVAVGADDYIARKWIEMIKDGKEGDYKGKDGVLRNPKVSGTLTLQENAKVKTDGLLGFPSDVGSSDYITVNTYMAGEYGAFVMHIKATDLPIINISISDFPAATSNSVGGTMLGYFKNGKYIFDQFWLENVSIEIDAGSTNLMENSVTGLVAVGYTALNTSVPDAADTNWITYGATSCAITNIISDQIAEIPRVNLFSYCSSGTNYPNDTFAVYLNLLVHEGQATNISPNFVTGTVDCDLYITGKRISEYP